MGSSIAKGISLPDLNKNSMLMTGLALLLVVGLFFLPEIMNLHGIPFMHSNDSVRETSAPQASSTAPVRESAVVSRSTQEEVRPLDPIQKINALIDQGYIEKLRDKKQRAAITGLGDENAAARTLDLDNLQPDASGRIVPANLAITWREIRSERVMKPLRKAQTDAQEILKAVPETEVEARYALFNYAQGVGLVLQGGERVMRAEEAPSYLENLDVAVTSALRNSKVDSATFEKWTKVNLGPILQSVDSTALKEKVKPPFNPGLTLTSVVVTQNSGRKGRFDPSQKAYVQMRGFIKAKDVAKVKLYKNNVFLRDVGISKNTDLNGGLPFKINRDDARAVYTFKVLSKTGRVYEKTYTFYNQAAQFPWNPKTKAFELPLSAYDTNADRAFAVRVKMTGGAQAQSSDTNPIVAF